MVLVLNSEVYTHILLPLAIRNLLALVTSGAAGALAVDDWESAARKAVKTREALRWYHQPQGCRFRQRDGNAYNLLYFTFLRNHSIASL